MSDARPRSGADAGPGAGRPHERPPGGRCPACGGTAVPRRHRPGHRGHRRPAGRRPARPAPSGYGPRRRSRSRRSRWPATCPPRPSWCCSTPLRSAGRTRRRPRWPHGSKPGHHVGCSSRSRPAPRPTPPSPRAPPGWWPRARETGGRIGETETFVLLQQLRRPRRARSGPRAASACTRPPAPSPAAPQAWCSTPSSPSSGSRRSARDAGAAIARHGRQRDARRRPATASSPGPTCRGGRRPGRRLAADDRRPARPATSTTDLLPVGQDGASPAARRRASRPSAASSQAMRAAIDRRTWPTPPRTQPLAPGQRCRRGARHRATRSPRAR